MTRLTVFLPVSFDIEQAIVTEPFHRRKWRTQPGPPYQSHRNVFLRILCKGRVLIYQFLVSYLNTTTILPTVTSVDYLIAEVFIIFISPRKYDGLRTSIS